jgi:hypothetical protein
MHGHMNVKLTCDYQIFWCGCSLQNSEGLNSPGTLWPPTYWPTDAVACLNSPGTLWPPTYWPTDTVACLNSPGTLWPPTYWPVDTVTCPKRLQFELNSSSKCVLSRSQSPVWQATDKLQWKIIQICWTLQHNCILCVLCEHDLCFTKYMITGFPQM